MTSQNVTTYKQVFPSPAVTLPKCIFSISSLKRRYSLTLGFVQGMTNHGSIAQIHLTMWALLECQRMFHPMLIVSLGIIFTSVGSSGFFTIRGCLCGLCSEKVRMEARIGVDCKLTRTSEDCGVLEIQRDRNSRSCFDPWFPTQHTTDRRH